MIGDTFDFAGGTASARKAALKQGPASASLRNMESLSLGACGGQYPLGVLPEAVTVADYRRLLSATLEMAVASVYQYCTTPRVVEKFGLGDTAGAADLVEPLLHGLLNFLHERRSAVGTSPWGRVEGAAAGTDLLIATDDGLRERHGLFGEEGGGFYDE